MSEEKPTFKVTDRRLFNADGTPREDVERPAEPLIIETTGTTETSFDRPSATGDSSAPASESATGAEAAHAAPASSAPTRPADGDAAGGDTRSRRAGQDSSGSATADDPNAFGELVMALAQPAAMALGMIDHPAMAGRDLDPALAKHYIDLLGTLQQKTTGNLSPQEEQLLAGLLAELRMQYVSISGARPGGGVGARGFTGSDITGGR